MLKEKILFSIRSWWHMLDRGLLWAVAGLIILGIFLIFSAGFSVLGQYHGTLYYVQKQLIFLGPLVLMMFIMSAMSPKWIKITGLFGFIMTVIMVLLTMKFGVTVKGSRRWINIFGVSLQASEMIKPTVAIVCAWLFSLYNKVEKKIYYFAPGALLGCVLFLLWLQPDFGMSVTVACIVSCQYFLSGMRKKWLVILGMFFLILTGTACITMPHVRARLNGFFGADEESKYQINRSMDALANGGWFGRGPSEGFYKNVIPDSHTDFIFSVAVEEFGFILGLFLIGLYAFFVLRGFYLIRYEKDCFAMICVGGLLTQIAFQSLYNIGSSLVIFPTKGMTLPFISYGGSSLASVAFGCGVILALTRRKNK